MRGIRVGNPSLRQRVRICLVYDCIYPHTIGGAERWYRNLAERLAAAGHDVTYITRRQWPRGAGAEVPGVNVVAVTPSMSLYAGGRRRILPPLVFGFGVLWHLLRRGRGYDVVHTAAFPYFSVLAAAAVRRTGGYSLVVDWHEVWTRAYWKEYLGFAKGWVGWAVQRLCLWVRHRPFCFARMTARRCLEEGLRQEVTVLDGLYVGTHELSAVRESVPLVMFAGRHIPEKRVTDLVPAIARARRRIPELRCVIFGDGPERAKVAELVHEHGLEDVIELPGFVDAERLDETMSQSLCMVLPVAPRGLRDGGRRGCVVGHAERRGRRPRQRGHRARRRPRQRPRRRQLLAGRPCRRDRPGPRTGDGAAPVHRGLVRAQRAACRPLAIGRPGRRAVRTPAVRATVLIGAYDSARTLGRAIDGALAQTVSDLEVLVIDDGSTDESPAIAEAYEDPRVRLLSMGANVGIASSLNAGLAAAGAPIVAINDADDWSEPQRLERQLALLDERPDVAVVGCRMREVDRTGRELAPRTTTATGDVRRALMRFNPIPNTSAALRRDVVLGLGGYDPRYRYATEYDLWLRVAEHHGVWALADVLATREMGGENVASRAERHQTREALAIRMRALARRRTLRGAEGLVAPALSLVTPMALKRARRRRLGQAP